LGLLRGLRVEDNMRLHQEVPFLVVRPGAVDSSAPANYLRLTSTIL
jgi:hypothetical protein